MNYRRLFGVETYNASFRQLERAEKLYRYYIYIYMINF